jgi:hypothetical protein
MGFCKSEMNLVLNRSTGAKGFSKKPALLSAFEPQPNCGEVIRHVRTVLQELSSKGVLL